MRTTEQLYGISPEKLRIMTYEQALKECLIGTKSQLSKLIQKDFMNRDEPLITAIHKAQLWCLLKIEELGTSKMSRFKLFIVYIKLAFKTLLRR